MKAINYITSQYEYILTLVFCFLFLGITSTYANERLGDKPIISDRVSVTMYDGQQILAGEFMMQVTALEHRSTEGNKGKGIIYIPFLEKSVEVAFDDIQVNAIGQLINGTIVSKEDENNDITFSTSPFLPLGILFNKEVETLELPISITKELKTKNGLYFPDGMDIKMLGLSIREQQSKVELSIAAATLTEGQFAYFNTNNVEINPEGIDLCNLDATLSDGFSFDDFEMPIRIKKYDPSVQDSTGMSGSYITFDCDGFKNFNLEAEYVFSRDQVIPANPANAQDTVVARFVINAPSLSNFMVFADVDPFMINGVDGVIFEADSAYIDYSDITNVPDFNYQDQITGETPDVIWKGFYMRKLGIQLPESVNSFNGGQTMEIAARDIVYDTGNGISLTALATNLLSIDDGEFEGWGVSIDTISLKIAYNSLDELKMNGEIYIPITGEGENIGYSASLGIDESGDPQANFVLELGSTYTIPFLNDAELIMDESSIAGVRYANGKFEPFTDLSGELNLKIGGEGSIIPEIEFDGLGFQNLKLNDITQVATSAVGEVTGGLDKMSIGAFTLAGKTFEVGDGTEDPSPGTGEETEEEEDGEDQKKLSGFPISIKSWSFESITKDSVSMKKLSAEFGLNFTSSSGGGGLSGEAKLGIKAKIEYAKLMSLTPWKALDYKGTDVGYISIDGEIGPVALKGAINFIDNDSIYGTGIKGGIELTIDLKGAMVQGMCVAQFGSTAFGNGGGDETYRYFFADAKLAFQPGIPLLGLSLNGFGGGVFYNMDKEYAPLTSAAGVADASDPTPGVSLSGATYTPSKDRFGVSASVLIANQGDPGKMCGEVEFSIQMNLATKGIEKIMFNGNMYAMAESLAKRQDAPIRVQANLEVNFVDRVLVGGFSYLVKYPSSNPILDGSGQGAFQVDLDPTDDKDHKNFFVFGSPSNPFTLDIILWEGGPVIQSMGYVMIGDSIEAALPLGDIHPALAIFESSSENDVDLQPDSGVAFGFRLSTDFEASGGPFYVSFEALFGFDASFAKYNGVQCSGSDGLIGMEGWYAKGRVFAYMAAKVGMDVDCWLYEGRVTLLDMQIAAALQAELPNPTWIKGNLDIKASVLNGLVEVDTEFEFEVGVKCKIHTSAVAALDGLEVVTDIQPINGSENFEIYHEPRLAFAYSVGENAWDLPSTENRLTIQPNPEQTYEFFPYITSIELKKADGSNENVAFEKVWNDDHTILALRTENIFNPLTDYDFDITLAWRSREFKNGSWSVWSDVSDDNGVTSEDHSVNFKTLSFPDKIAIEMLNSDRHMPGNGQRNFTSNFANAEIQFRQEGFAGMFSETKQKDHNGTQVDVNYNYAVRLTKPSDNSYLDIPINEYPGDNTYQEWNWKTGYYYIFNTKYPYQYWGMETKTSKELKYGELNDPSTLEKNTIYKLQILGIPKPNQTSQELTSTVDSVALATDVEGVQVQSVSNTLGEQTSSPFMENDILYEYHFKTSIYDNLKEKLETMSFLKHEYGKSDQGSGYPGSETETLARSGYKGPEVKNDYYLYKLSDEGFDKWERRRLKQNIDFKGADSGNGHPFWSEMFSTTPQEGKWRCTEWETWCISCDCEESTYDYSSKSRYNYMMDNYRDSKWKLWYFFQLDGINTNQSAMISAFDRLLDKEQYKKKGWWYDITFPYANTSWFNKGVLKLTSTEIESGIPENQISGTGCSGGSPECDLYNYTTKWEFSFVSKRRRVLIKQWWNMSVISWLMDKYDEKTRKSDSSFNIGGWLNDDPIAEEGNNGWFWDKASNFYKDKSWEMNRSYGYFQELYGNSSTTPSFYYYYKNQWDLQDETLDDTASKVQIQFTEKTTEH